MIRIFFSFLFILCLNFTGYSQTKLKSKLIASCCDVGGRCTGSSNCTACSNCSGCKHCAQNGGSCGVCSGVSSRSSFTSTSSNSTRSTKGKKHSSSYSNSKSSSSNNFYNNDLTTSTVSEEVLYNTVLRVKTLTLKVRTGPGKDYPIVVKLEKGEYVRCLETTSGSWIKVEVVGISIEGYVFKTNLE